MIRRSVDLPVPLRPMTQTRSRGSICRLASARSGRWPYAIETRSRLMRGMLADRREEKIPEVACLAGANALHGEQRIHGRRTQPRHLAKRHIMKDHVRRDTARSGDVEAHRAQPLEERAVDPLPRFGFHPGSGARRVLARSTLPRKRQSGIAVLVLKELDPFRCHAEDGVLVAIQPKQIETDQLLDVTTNLGDRRLRQETERAQRVMA